MNELYNKICLMIGEILCYSRKVKWAMEPVYEEDNVVLMFRDENNSAIEVPVEYQVLNKAHDHTLETLIFRLMKMNDLL